MNFSWDDLKLFLAVYDKGSLPEAAKKLKISHSTAFRRINQFEKSLGVRLFDRLSTGLAPTPAAQEILDYVRDIEARTEEISRSVAGADYSLKGTVRVTTTHGLSLQFMNPVFARFQDLHPDIHIDVQWGDQIRKLSRHESDVIILPTKKPPENAFGRKLGKIVFGLFASKDFVKTYGIPKNVNNLKGLKVISLGEGFGEQPFYSWYQKATENALRCVTCSSFLTIREATAAGMGIGLMPYYYGAGYKDLLSIQPNIDGTEQDLWLLTHRDLKNTVRIRTFMDFAYEEILKLRPALEGSSVTKV